MTGQGELVGAFGEVQPDMFDAEGVPAYGVTPKGGGTGVLHLVHGSMDDHQPWRDAVRTVCGRSLVAGNYFTGLEDYVRSYNCRGTLCAGCDR